MSRRSRVLVAIALLALPLGCDAARREEQSTLTAAPLPTSLPPCPVAVAAPAACVLDGTIYLTGGWGLRELVPSGAFSDRAFAFDPVANAFERLPDLPHARAFHVAVAAAGAVWVFGGMSDGGDPAAHETNIAAIDRFDPARGVWETASEMEVPRNRLAAAVIGDRIFLAGGMGQSEQGGDSARVDVFDARTRTWSRAADLPAPCHGHGLAAHDGRLVLVGGADRRSTWLLDEGASTWRSGAALPEPRLFASAVAAGRDVYAVGNRAMGEIAMLRYTPTDDRWHTLPGPSVEVHRAATVVHAGALYVLCGDSDAGESARLSRCVIGTHSWTHSP